MSDKKEVSVGGFWPGAICGVLIFGSLTIARAIRELKPTAEPAVKAEVKADAQPQRKDGDE